MTHNGARILVVEAEPLIRMTIVETLEDAGYVVLAASDGREALELLDDPDDIKLIVTAIALSGVSGIEIARRARTHGEAVPVVFASGHGDKMAEASPPAPCRHLHKPYSMDALRTAVESLLAETVD